MERFMSKFEQEVDYNLSESGVHPMLLKELLSDAPEYMDHLMNTDLNYPYVNGTPELRENIAALYKGATRENVLVTVGAIEANYIATRTLLSAGDEIVIMLPNYMQIWGIAKNHGLRIRTFHLREDNGWGPDLDELNRAVTPETKMIAVCNPDNPTGYALPDAEMQTIVAAAERAGAWILADEVYSGAERTTDEQTPSFFGMDHFVRISFGLPHDYLTAALDRIHDLIEELKA
jgi:aspartate/methionine/tyrosine aminotransferase